jgi:serine/threonine protein kinase
MLAESGYFCGMVAPWPEQLPRGFDFERYEVLDCVWHGSAASVYRAQSVGLNGVVALKVFERAKADKLPDFLRLSRNARAAAAVRHPNVAAILDLGVWEERPYVVTEWLEGCDLQDYLTRWGVMAEDEIAELALHLISGLSALHDAGAAHGDIKPRSIFLCNSPDGDVVPKLVLSDLPHFNGLSSSVDSTTRQIAVSTPAYLPPEAIRGRGGGPRADQYSLCAVLYECGVGQAPFVGETLLDLLKAVASGNIASPRSLRPELSERLERVLLRALSSEPNARFDTLADLGRALWPLASDQAKAPWAPTFGSEPGDAQGSDPAPPPAEPHPLAEPRPAHPSARSPATMILLAASIALSIGIGALYLYSMRGAGTHAPPIDSGSSGPASALPARF